ncbi:protein phosphatase 2C domain-containing protein [Nonomuraea sp. NPDC048826]|uniref:protein phosphatase 2C domain-containing protein n=1 Tax=Nonomuraea sp. NPDC048826 TaxID=3364347 RepID=UPI003715806B
MLRVSYASAAAPDPTGRANEDYVLAGPSWVVVLDGATPAPGVAPGCRHGVPWLVRTLAGALAPGMDGGDPLPEVLAAAITATMKAHDGSCDLGNPHSPSATVALTRHDGDRLEYLVLCDAAVVLWRRDGSVTVVRDDRLDHLPGGRPYSLELVASTRNRPGGFWVASTCPEAADQALTGAAPVRELRGAALFTDGVTRLADWYGRAWESLAAGAAEPEQLLADVREQELARGVPRGKPHDDATAVWVTFPPG